MEVAGTLAQKKLFFEWDEIGKLKGFAMILYEVHLKVKESLLEVFKAWLESHKKEMLETGLFVSAHIFENVEEKNSLLASYKLKTKEDLETYLKEWAPRLREDGEKRFPEGFEARRKVYEESSF